MPDTLQAPDLFSTLAIGGQQQSPQSSPVSSTGDVPDLFSTLQTSQKSIVPDLSNSSNSGPSFISQIYGDNIDKDAAERDRLYKIYQASNPSDKQAAQNYINSNANYFTKYNDPIEKIAKIVQDTGSSVLSDPIGTVGKGAYDTIGMLHNAAVEAVPMVAQSGISAIAPYLQTGALASQSPDLGNKILGGLVTGAPQLVGKLTEGSADQILGTFNPQAAARGDYEMTLPSQGINSVTNTIQNAVGGQNDPLFNTAQMVGSSVLPLGEATKVLDPLNSALASGIQSAGEKAAGIGTKIAPVAGAIGTAKAGLAVGGLKGLAGAVLGDVAVSKGLTRLGSIIKDYGPGWLNDWTNVAKNYGNMTLGTSFGEPAVQNVIKTFPTKIEAMQDLATAAKAGGNIADPVIEAAKNVGVDNDTIDGLRNGDEDTVKAFNGQLQKAKDIHAAAQTLFKNNLDGTLSTSALKTFLGGVEGGTVMAGLSAASSPGGQTDYSSAFGQGAALGAPFAIAGEGLSSPLKEAAATRQFSPISYGTPLDAVHQEAMQSATPQQTTAVNNLRGVLANGGKGELYVLPPDQFQKVAGSNASGATIKTSNGQSTIYLNSDNLDSSLAQAPHEVVHTLMNQAPREQVMDLEKSISSQFTPEELAQQADKYQVKRQADNPGQQIPPLSISDITKEILADNIKSWMYAGRINELGLPKQLSAKINDSTLGLNGQETTPLGLQANPKVQDAVENFLRNQLPDAFMPQQFPEPPTPPPNSFTPPNTPPVPFGNVPPPTQPRTVTQQDLVNGIRQKLYQQEANITAQEREAGVRNGKNLVKTPTQTTPLVDTINAIQGVHEARVANPNLTPEQSSQIIQQRFQQATPLGKKFYESLTPDERAAMHDYTYANPEKAFNHFSTNPTAETEDLQQAAQDKKYEEENLTKYQKKLMEATGQRPPGYFSNADQPSLSEIPSSTNEVPRVESEIKGNDESVETPPITPPPGYAPQDNRVQPRAAEPKTDVNGNPVLTETGLKNRQKIDRILADFQAGKTTDSKGRPQVQIAPNGQPIPIDTKGRPIEAPTFKTRATVSGRFIDTSGNDPYHNQILEKGIYEKAAARAAERTATRPMEPPETPEMRAAKMEDGLERLNKGIANSEVMTAVYDHAANTQPEGETTGEERTQAYKTRNQDKNFSQDGVTTFVPKSLEVSSKGDILAKTYSLEKRLANAEHIFQQAKEHGIPLPYDNSSVAEMAHDMRVRDFLHAHGYKGDGTPVVGGWREPDPNFAREAQRLALPPAKLDFLSLAEGFPEFKKAEGQKALLKDSVDAADFADSNKMRPNALREALKSKGVEMEKLLQPTEQTLRLDRMEKFVAPGDQNLPDAIRAQQMRQRVIGHEVIGKELPDRNLSSINYSPKLNNAEEAKEPFYSTLEKTIADKMPSKASAGQIMGLINGNGVKADEVKWSGIDRFLKDNPNPTKQQVLDYLRTDGKVQINENVLGSSGKQWSQDDLDALERAANRTGDWTAFDNATREYEDQQLGSNANASGNQTKFGQYQLLGGKNYTESVFTLPSSKNNYTSSHFPDQTNYLAHARSNERVDSEGNPGLFIEEMQSDRHQQGREKGYIDPEYEENRKKLKKELANKFVSKYDRYDFYPHLTPEERREYDSLPLIKSSIPDAPYRKTEAWTGMVFRRMLQKAVASGKDWIGWTTGETQADRYDLSKQVDRIVYSPIMEVDPSGTEKPSGDYDIKAIKNGNSVLEETVNEKELPALLGKEIAQKIKNGDGEENSKLKDPQGVTVSGKVLQGEDLKVGGEGMRNYYDKIVPSVAKDIGKKFGATLSTSEIKAGDKKVPIWKMEITPAMRESILKNGQPLFSPKISDAGLRARAKNKPLEGLSFPAYVPPQRPLAHLTYKDEE